jgi:hypothetical protein
MARVMRTSAEARAEMAPDPRVRFVKRDARRLVTIRGTDPAGETDGKFLHEWVDSKKGKRSLSNALVRFQPRADAMEGEVLGAIAALKDAGALAVKLLPKPAMQATVVDAAAPVEEVVSIRSFVEKMVDEAKTEDRDALRALVSKAMDRGEHGK